MSTRTAVTIVGGIVGAYFGYPQLGLMVGSLVGAAVDPEKIQGPRIGEVNVQTSQEGAPRTIIYGTIACYGNVIQTGQVVKVEVEESQGKGGPEVSNEHALRTYAIRVCEGPVAGFLRFWEDNKLVYDVRPGSAMIAESQKWAANKVFYMGDEAQLPDPTLVATVNSDTPAYRSSAYFVAINEDLTERRGSIPQYRVEVATTVTQAAWPGYTWTDKEATGWTSQAFVTVADDGSTLAGGAGSPGQTWVSQPSMSDFVQVSIPNGISSAAFAVGKFIGVVHGNNNDAWVLNGSSWDEVDVSALPYERLGIVAGGSKFMIATVSVFLSQARTFTSTDGINWDEHSITYSHVGVPRYAGSLFLMLSTSQVAYSADGVSWATHALPIASPQDIIYSAELGLWLITGGGSTQRVATSPNLSTWTLQTTPNIDTKSAAWSPSLGLFAVVGNAGAFMTSPDGVNWTNQSVISGDNFTDVEWNPVAEKFVAVSSSTSHIFTSDSTPGSIGGEPILLSEIVADIHERCGSDASMYDVSELDDLVAGLSLAGDYTGASAIDVCRPVYRFDKSIHDGKFWYPKRGAAVIETLTIDELTEIPDNTRREQALDVPNKFHLRYQHAGSGYAPVKATVPRTPSPDFLTTGEASYEIPIVLDEDQAMQCADKMYKVMRAEQDGTTEIVVPMYVGAKYAEANCIGLSLRGRTDRYRIDQIDFVDWKLRLTLKPDRQSAYTSNLTGVPIPPPTLPPSTIVGQTELAILDIPARIDSEDDLNYLVAVDGALPPWYGARYQRSLDGGTSYVTVVDIPTASVMGVLLESVADASEHVTDYTNTIRVQLYRATHSLESITESQFMTEGGALALEKSDGSWEILQCRDWVETSEGIFEGTVLHRGLLNSGTSSHTAGMRLVMLPRPTHIPAQSAWIGTYLTHRAISLGDTADDTLNQTTMEFVGRSQIEWPVAHLEVERDLSDVITGTWAPRHRFGTDVSPVASINFQGYRVTLDDGSDTVTFDVTVPTFTYDASALSNPVTVSVSALNRITGAGPATSESI